MRIVTNAQGTRRVEIECSCGYMWLSVSRSGRTTCPDCGEHVYIPAELRRKVQGVPEREVPSGGDRGFFGGDTRAVRPDRAPRYKAPRTPKPKPTMEVPDLSRYAGVLAPGALGRQRRAELFGEPPAQAHQPRPTPAQPVYRPAAAVLYVSPEQHAPAGGGALRCRHALVLHGNVSLPALATCQRCGVTERVTGGAQLTATMVPLDAQRAIVVDRPA